MQMIHLFAIFSFPPQKKKTEEDEINDIDQWSTWPGYLALALRMLIAIWFIYDLTKTFTVEVRLTVMVMHFYRRLCPSARR